MLPGQAALEQQRGRAVELLGGLHEHGTPTVPGTEPVGFMPGLLVAPGQFEHEIAACLGARGCDPGCLTAGLEGLAYPKRLALLEVLDCLGQRRKPCEAALVAVARHRLGEIAWQGERGHAA